MNPVDIIYINLYYVKLRYIDNVLQRRSLIFLSSTACKAILATAFFFSVHGSAQAVNECGTGTVVTCSGPTYPSGITYDNVNDLTMTLDSSVTSVSSGVSVTTASGSGGTVDVIINSPGASLAGSAAGPGFTPASYNFPGTIWLQAAGTATGSVSAELKNGTISNTIRRHPGVMIWVQDSSASADANFTMSGGTITNNFEATFGTYVYNGGTGNSEIEMTGGTVDMPNNVNSIGLVSQVGRNAVASSVASMKMTGGTITAVGVGAGGIQAVSSSGVAKAMLSMSGGEIELTGGSVDNDYGFGSAALALSERGSDASATMTGGKITTTGEYGYGIQAVAAAYAGTAVTGGASLTVEGGTITTGGRGALAAVARNNTSGISHVVIGSTLGGTGPTITTTGDYAHAVSAITVAADVNVEVYRGSLDTDGLGAYGVFANITDTASAADIDIELDGGSISTGKPGDPTAGNYSNGVYASNRGAGGVAIETGLRTDLGKLTVETYGAYASGLYAAASGSGSVLLSYNNTSVTTAGNVSYGLFGEIQDASNASDLTISFKGGSVTTQGLRSHAVYASTVGSGLVDVTVQNSASAGDEITTQNDGAYGVYAENTGTGDIRFTIPAATISTSGNDAHAAAAVIDNPDSAGNIIGNFNAALTTSGDGSYGAFLRSEGSGNVSATFTTTPPGRGSVIKTSGGASHAVYLRSVKTGNASFSGAVTEIRTTGAGADAILVTNEDAGGSGTAAITLEGGSISTSGAGAYGVYARTSGAGSASVGIGDAGSGTTISVSGDGSLGTGAYSAGGGLATINMTGGRINVLGDALAAIGFDDMSAVGDATVAEVTIGSDATIDASGASAGYAIWNGDDRSATSITVTSSGTVTGHAMMGGGSSTFTLAGGSFTGNIYGDFDPSTGTPAANPGSDTFIWSGGTLNSGFYGQGGNDKAIIAVPNSASFAAAIFDGGEDGGAPPSETSSDIDEITFAGDNDGVVGANILNWETFTVSDSANIAFADNSLVLDGYDGGNSNGMGDLHIMPGSSLTAGAANGSIFTLTGNLANDGALSMLDGAYGGNFVVGGYYHSDGGILAIDVNFSDLKADVLTFGGGIDGITDINIVDIGSTGRHGNVLIADMTNATNIDQNEFEILNEKNNLTASGLYLYGIRYDLNGNPAAGLPPGLYLTSEGNPNGPVQPNPPGPARLQPFVPLYEGYQSALLDMNRLPTMRQRVGKRAWLGVGRFGESGTALRSDRKAGAYQAGDQGTVLLPESSVTPALENVWGRINGRFSHLDPKSAATGYDYDLSTFEMQAGVDGLFYENGPGALVGGFTVHYRTGEAKYRSGYGDSKMHPDGYGFGGTLTWYGDNGFYADGQAQMTWYSSELKTEDLSRGVDDSGAFGYALSLEAGQQFPLDGNDLTLMPQGQLSWSSVHVDSFTGAYNDDVSFDTGDSLLARLGLAVEKELYSTDENGLARNGNIYGIANLYYEFMGETKALIEQTYQASSALDDFSGEIGFGGTYGWEGANNITYGLYGEVTASTGFDNGSYSYGGNLGFRVRW